MTTRVWRQRVAAAAPSGWPANIHPVIQRIYAARGVSTPDGAEHRLARLLSPSLLGGMDRAVAVLMDAIASDKRIVVAGDYDCDGATGTAVAVRGLHLLGAKHVAHVVPNRFVHGYGLSEALVESLQPSPDLIVTVDNGVASVAGVAAARARGIGVLITDHHLPGDGESEPRRRRLPEQGTRWRGRHVLPAAGATCIDARRRAFPERRT
jgi:single-stranded-DNA-specific exonuclease